jgi:polyisoprenoid-binding protein YceI
MVSAIKGFNAIKFIALIFFVGHIQRVSAAPVILHIDNTHSSIQFSVPFVGVTEVTGNFERFCGLFYFNETNMAESKMELFIDASSINTGLRIRDKDLRNDYLEADKYPIINFTSTAITSPGPGNLDVTGELDLHGKKKTVRLSISVIGDLTNSDGGRELGMKLMPIMLPRRDYGIMEGTIGSGTVGDSITVTATVRVRDVAPYRKEFDSKYPDAARQTRITQRAKYSGATKMIQLMSYGERNFMAFSDDEWMWLSELRNVGPSTYKCTSFNNVIELRNDQVVFVSQDGAEVLNMVK